MTESAQAEPEQGTTDNNTSLWRDSDFNKLWGGQAISVLGSEITVLALPLTAILMLDASAAQVGLLEAARTAAELLVMLFAGVLVDRVRRRPLMIWADIGRGLVIGAVPLFAFIGYFNMNVLYVAAFLIGSMEVLFNLSRFAYLPTLVTSRRLVSANSRMLATESLGGILGSSLGGFLVSIFRPVFVLAADAVSFFVSALLISRIKKPEPEVKRDPVPARQMAGAVVKDIVEGIRITFTNRYVGPLALNATGANFGSMMVLTLFILYATRELGITPQWIGIIYAFGAAGGVTGALLTTWATKRFGFGRALLGSMIIYRVLALTPFVFGPLPVMIAIFCAIWFLTVFGVVMSNILQGAIQQHVIPPSLRGRVAAAARGLGSGVVPLAALLAGFAGEFLGLRNGILIGAVIMVPPLLWVIFSEARKVQDLSTDAPAGDPDAPVDIGSSRQ